MQVGGPERWILLYIPPLTRLPMTNATPPAPWSVPVPLSCTAAELGKQHHDQVVASVMFPQVIEKVLEGRRDVDPQLVCIGTWLKWVSKLPCAV